MPKKKAPIAPVIVKKVYEQAHDSHHGGAWKIAFADFMTAMFVFFLVMWLLASTEEEKLKSLAEYFSPTVTAPQDEKSGSISFFGGASILSNDNFQSQNGQAGKKTIVQPLDRMGRPIDPETVAKEKKRFEQIRRDLAEKLAKNASLKRLSANVRFTETREGMRIDLIDNANFSLFISGTDILSPGGINLLNEVSPTLRQYPNGLIVRGHTDAYPVSPKLGTNNWKLSTSRAEATRAFFTQSGVPDTRFFRIEGVAEREPYFSADPYDSRNRRISVTLGWRNAPL